MSRLLLGSNFDDEASIESQANVDQIDHQQGLSCKVIKNISDTSERVDKMRHKVSMVKLLLSSLSKNLTNPQTRLVVLLMPIWTKS